MSTHAHTEQQIEGSLGSTPLRVGVVVSQFNRWITEPLLEGARAEFIEKTDERSGDEIVVAWVPGAYELPVIASEMARSGAFDGVAALGCIIRGDTRHDKLIADSVALSLGELAVREGVPMGLGLITAENADQAEARAGGSHGNKGTEAMSAVIDTIAMQRAIREQLAQRSGGKS